MTDEEYKKLAKLVTYLLESEDWKYIWINEYAEPIRLFMFKTGISYRLVHNYVEKSLQKLLGPVFNVTQRRLANKCCGQDDLLFKPKTLTQKRKEEQLRIAETKQLDEKQKQLKEFCEKYLAHFGYRSTKNKAQFVKEKRFFISKGFCSWEVKK